MQTCCDIAEQRPAAQSTQNSTYVPRWPGKRNFQVQSQFHRETRLIMTVIVTRTSYITCVSQPDALKPRGAIALEFLET